LGLADAQLLSSAASATVFVVAAGTAKMGSIRGALKRLQLSRANLIGAVLTKYDSAKVSYGYGYGEGHEYRYEYARPATQEVSQEVSVVDPQIPQLADLQKRLLKIADKT
jgi:Mrp family chromosome partitioning ATPase